jgi:hypothetical protein
VIAACNPTRSGYRNTSSRIDANRSIESKSESNHADAIGEHHARFHHARVDTNHPLSRRGNDGTFPIEPPAAGNCRH